MKFVIISHCDGEFDDVLTFGFHIEALDLQGAGIADPNGIATTNVVPFFEASSFAATHLLGELIVEPFEQHAITIAPIPIFVELQV